MIFQLLKSGIKVNIMTSCTCTLKIETCEAVITNVSGRPRKISLKARDLHHYEKYSRFYKFEVVYNLLIIIKFKN